MTLVGCRRWKAARTGVEPLREFDAATSEQGAHKRLYVAVGEVSDAARLRGEERIRLVGEEELTTLLANEHLVTSAFRIPELWRAPGL